MNRLWKRWIALALFVIVLGVTFVFLGRWQLDRLDQRHARNDAILANEAAAPKPFDQVFAPGVTITDADQWQRVIATGTFDAEHQFQVRYRFNNSQPGFEVVTPLRTTTGQTVLVNRGFIHVPGGRGIPTTLPAPPAGQVTVMGHVRRSEQGKPQAIDPNEGMVRLINAPAIGRTLPYPVLDGWIATLEMNPAQQAEFETLALPEISDGPHFWYAMQWFLFALIGLTGLVIFIRGDLRERRNRRAGTAAEGPARTPDSLTS
ncbi:SURF1 family cytochrome oxidase biogenesis protein [Granulicoccus sp. GXG6511]|uniref:SURF1 family cytochrome oxidase biogenesis protein n=1 Tax=Granulicoccus sp. GXG6511 TaxID=3381351 RepID=UPI003D7E9E54